MRFLLFFISHWPAVIYILVCVSLSRFVCITDGLLFPAAFFVLLGLTRFLATCCPNPSDILLLIGTQETSLFGRVKVSFDINILVFSAGDGQSRGRTVVS